MTPDCGLISLLKAWLTYALTLTVQFSEATGKHLLIDETPFNPIFFLFITVKSCYNEQMVREEQRVDFTLVYIHSYLREHFNKISWQPWSIFLKTNKLNLNWRTTGLEIYSFCSASLSEPCCGQLLVVRLHCWNGLSTNWARKALGSKSLTTNLWRLALKENWIAMLV